MPVDALPIELKEPNGPCPIDTTRPTFRWTRRRITQTKLAADLAARGATLRLRVWRVGQRTKPETAVARRPTKDWPVDPRSNSFTVAAREKALEVGAAYAWRLVAVDRRGKTLAHSNLGLFFVDDPALPISLRQLLCCGGARSSTFGWVRAYGSPLINAEASGFLDHVGTAELTGTSKNGDAISRRLPSKERIIAGRHYVVSFAARAAPREVAYVRFRVIAHSVALPTTGEHPPSSANAVIIGESARITNDVDWSLVVLPPWHASKDFTRISIAVISDQDAATDGKPAGPTEGPRATGLISAICVREVAGCDSVGGLLGEGPHVTIGGGARLVDDGEAVAHLVGSDLGAMIDVFGEPFNDAGEHRWYRPGDECVSVGGWIPDDLEDYVPWLHENHGVPPSELVDKLVDQLLSELDAPDLSQLEPIKLKPPPCPEHDPVPHPLRPRQNVIVDPAPPFAGRDVVFVHGFVLDHVIARYVTADPVATAVHASLQGGADAEWAELSDAVGQEWPSVPDPYRVVPPEGDSDGVGYFRATTYWAPHIQQYFTEPEHPNRYIVTGYNCSQRLPFAVHTLLSQIADAMNTGAGVQRGGKYLDDADCFGVEYAIVSHSTGALVTCVAMAIAERSGTDPAVAAIYGDISAIAERAKVHISLHGAVGGSDLATLALAATAMIRHAIPGAADAVVSELAELVEGYQLARRALVGLALQSEEMQRADEVMAGVAVSLGVVDSADILSKTITESVLVDLSPFVARIVWRHDISDSPVPTLTVAGGHPSFGGTGGLVGVTKPALPGFDDGVVTTNSQSGSNSLLIGIPDTYVPIPPAARVYDMGLAIQRAAPYFVEQYRPPLATYGSTPFLSPSGMVQPVLHAPLIPRHTNHFTFIQAAAEHSFPTDNTSASSERYVPTFGIANHEESLVVEHKSVFSEGLVNPSIASFVRRFERRLDLTIRISIAVPQITFSPPDIGWRRLVFPVTQTIWRRFYDLLSVAPATSTSVTMTVTVGMGNDVVLPPPPTSGVLSAPLLASDVLGTCGWAYRFVLPI